MTERSARDTRLRRYWGRQAGRYDRQMAVAESRFFAGTRERLCAQATGDVLEVAIGTGLNLPHYPESARVSGVEWSEPMLEVARRRAADLGRPVTLRQGDAMALDFPDTAFDTVVCTFSLCAIPDHRRALAEMIRVLRPGGLLLLADHVISTAWPVRAAQRAIDLVSVPLHGEHFCRRPLDDVRAMGLIIEGDERGRYGIIERVRARKPAS